MDRERWNQLEEIFTQALGLPESQRAAFLDRACGDDSTLRQEVASLIARAHGDGESLQAVIRDAVANQNFVKEQETTRWVGRKLGSYEILERLGAGGMGEVFRATDTRLRRTVAIKVLPHDRITDTEHRRRFLQEARAASALNHPSIVTLHDIATENGIDYLVMEFVPGKPLDKVITPKGLPLAELVGYATQIASALAAAHAAGIVHRDIKPANVMVTAESQIKILDFGLAKLVDRVSTGHDETVTQASALTEAGTVMGTVAYMSPEQASGKAVDHRTDIFSLGVILYEMAAGKRPFRGESHVETMNAIIHDAWPKLPNQPAGLDEILDKALAKDPKDRYQHAGDLALDLRRLLEKPARTDIVIPSNSPSRILSWITAVILLVLALPVAWWAGTRTSPPAESAAIADVTITPLTTGPGYNGEPTISPDGQTIAYVSDRAGRFDLYLRQIGTASDIALTHDQGDNIQPSFSPDGRQIAFVSSRAGGPVIFYPCCDSPLIGGSIWTMPALGGTARRIVEEGNFPAWSPDGSTIVFVRQRRSKLYEVSSSGGEVREIPLQFPAAVPNALALMKAVYSSDGRWIFFGSQTGQTESLFAVPASGGKVVQLVPGRHPAWDSASQSIVFVNADEGRNNSLWALPFSTENGVAGNPRPLTIGRGRDWRPAVSRDGKLIAYTALTATFNLEVVPFDAEAGKIVGDSRALTDGNQIVYFMRFSPDGHSVAFQSSRGAGTHIWRVDIGGATVQLTSDPKFEELWPYWSPDGNSISFVRNAVTSPLKKSLWLIAPDGANPRQMIEGTGTPRWLPDGSGLLYVGTADNQLAIFELASQKTSMLPGQSAIASMPFISSDGKWIVYQSVAKGSGAGNIDVGAIPLDGGEGRLVVSTPHQEMHPFLSPSNRWLYFQWEHKNIYRVPGPAQNWQRAEPVKVTDFPESGGLFLEDPQISSDGKQLLYSRGKISGDIWILSRKK